MLTLPVLNEIDERVSLMEILRNQERPLSRNEAWSICFGACEAISEFSCNHELYQILCVTPDSLAFDIEGNTCFLDILPDPKPVFVPPEYEKNGNSDKSHLFSLGMTLLYAVGYNRASQLEGVQSLRLSESLDNLLTELTMECDDERPSCITVINTCNEVQLRENMVDDILRNDIFVSELSNRMLTSEVAREVCAEMTEHCFTDNCFTEYTFDQEKSETTSKKANRQYRSMSCENVIFENMTEVDITRSLSLPNVYFNEETLIKKIDTACSIENEITSLKFTSLELTSLKNDILISSDQVEYDNADNVLENSAQEEYLLDKTILEIYESGSYNSLLVSASDTDATGDNSITLDSTISDKYNSSSPDPANYTTLSTPPLQTIPIVLYSPPVNHRRRHAHSRNSQTPNINDHSNIDSSLYQPTPQSTHILQSLRNFGQQLPYKEIFSNSNDNMTLSLNNKNLDKNTSKHKNSGIVLSSILDTISCALSETELWAITKECIKYLSSLKTENLPEYVCLGTLEIKEDGSIYFNEVNEHATLELFYVAPESKITGEINEQTCIYGVAVILLATADYKMPANQEPALSKQFENLLISMTQNDANLRPTLNDVKQACDKYYSEQESIGSNLVCEILFRDAQKIKDFNKSNPIITNLLSDEVETDARENHALVIDSIKNKDHLLKPVDCRVLSERVIEKSIHELLMEEIRNSRFFLKKCRQPRLLKINAMYRSDKHLMKSLINVTKPNTKVYQTPPFERKTVKSQFRNSESYSSSSCEDEINIAPSSLQVQLTRDQNTGLYSILPFDLHLDSKRFSHTVKRRRSRGLQRTQSQNMNRSQSTSFCNNYISLMSSNPNLNSHPLSTTSSDIYDCKPFSNRSKLESINSPPSPSWSKDSGISGIKNAAMMASAPSIDAQSYSTFTCNQQPHLQIGDSAQRMRENESQIINLLRRNLPLNRFDSHLGEIDENSMAEYILSLAGLKWLTFMHAMSEKFTHLYFTEHFLISLYETINNRIQNNFINSDIIRRVKRSKAEIDSHWSSSASSSSSPAPPHQINYNTSPPLDRTVTTLNSQYSTDSAFTPINKYNTNLTVLDYKPRPVSVHSPLYGTRQEQIIQPTKLHGASTMNLSSSNHQVTSNLCRSYSQMLTKEGINVRSSIRRREARNNSDFPTNTIRPISICTNSKKVDNQPRLPTNGRVIYYHAEMLMSRKSAPISPDLDIETHGLIEKKLKEIIQHLSIEQKNRRKTHRYYNKLLEMTKQRKVGNEQKILLSNVSRQLNETNEKLFYLEASKKHLEMVHAEYWSIPKELLGSLINTREDQALHLFASDDHYRYFVFENDESNPSSLQAATPVALMAYLFARSALSEGYIHKFFFVYRYLLTPSQLLHFLITRYCSAEQSSNYEHNDICVRVKVRVLTLLQVWIESYFSIDFKDNFNLSATLKCFLRQHQVKDNRESLLQLFERCESKVNNNLYTKTQSGKSLDNNNSMPGIISNNSSLLESNWEYKSFTLSNYSAHDLAKEILYSHQNLFQYLHPVNFLGTENRGFKIIDDIVVTDNTRNRNQKDDVLKLIIEHDRKISYWVSIQIICCETSKEQVQTIIKFIHTARISSELRNFAGCLSILYGLYNIVIRQLPAWRNLPSKVKSLYENLISLSNLLRNDVMLLIKDDETKNRSTIPCCNIFIQQIQNLENDTLLLVSGMSDWSKLCVISNAIDQIRHFQLRPYNISSTCENLWKNVNHASTLDLISIASKNKGNVPKISSSRTFLQRIRSKFS